MLEGGYSGYALTSGALAHLSGLIGGHYRLRSRETRRNIEEGGPFWAPQSRGSSEPPPFYLIDATPSSSHDAIPIPPTSMTLRDRKKPAFTEPSSVPSLKSEIRAREVRSSPGSNDERERHRLGH